MLVLECLASLDTVVDTGVVCVGETLTGLVASTFLTAELLCGCFFTSCFADEDARYEVRFEKDDSCLECHRESVSSP